MHSKVNSHCKKGKKSVMMQEVKEDVTIVEEEEEHELTSMEDLFSIFLILCLAKVNSSFGFDKISSNSFNVLDYGAVGNGQTDDSQAFLRAWGDMCKATTGIPTLIIPSRKTYLLHPLTFQGPCKATSVHVQVLGHIISPRMAAWGGYDKFAWIYFSDVNGLIMGGSGRIDGQGLDWWRLSCKFDELDNLILSNNIFLVILQAMHFSNCNGLQLFGLRHENSQRNHISIDNCNGVILSNLHIMAPQDSPNTDGIDISSSSHILIQNSYIGTGDDCVAINGGSSYINITRVTCGPGHGISVGSLGGSGAHDTVEEVHVKNCSFTGTMNGVRIKTWQGGSGYARKIWFEQINFVGVDNPIIIDQFYCGGVHNCANSVSKTNYIDICFSTSLTNYFSKNLSIKNADGFLFAPQFQTMETLAVQVSDVTYSGVQGTSIMEEAINLSCSKSNGCTNIVMNQINITSSVLGKKTYSYSFNAHGRSTAVTPPVNLQS
ncbi:hypothetical protein HHK36_025794 [Tetracentron sinense]|uniref:Uncharacterized protein n=1 Tax=Tetracentron sinense TaxID=13715 RepID=A0A834YM46_TETSI|nr:hypothetical protein HHK36_025794 [Tetracentron sinense]